MRQPKQNTGGVVIEAFIDELTPRMIYFFFYFHYQNT